SDLPLAERVIFKPGRTSEFPYTLDLEKFESEEQVAQRMLLGFQLQDEYFSRYQQRVGVTPPQYQEAIIVSHVQAMNSLLNYMKLQDPHYDRQLPSPTEKINNLAFVQLQEHNGEFIVVEKHLEGIRI